MLIFKGWHNPPKVDKFYYVVYPSGKLENSRFGVAKKSR